MTYREVFGEGEKTLQEAGIADAKNDAWLLLAMACKMDHTYYYMHIDEQMPEEYVREFQALLAKRGEHIPLQYITGEQEFMGMTFAVNSSVLIPRQDTETLVEEALRLVKPGMKVLDMCTGSGCVLISILKNVHGAKGAGYDISKHAVNVAKENAKRNEVAAVFERSNLFEDVMPELYDVMVSNPPYIRTDELPLLMPEVSQFEPQEALDGGADGLSFYRRILEDGQGFLKEGGYLLFEIGCDQAEDVSFLMRAAGLTDVYVVQDLAHHDRVVCGRKPLSGQSA